MSAHATHEMHPNSERAYAEGMEQMSRRARECYAVLMQSYHPMTDRQVLEALGYGDMNAVRPRISELVDQEWVHEVGSTVDHVTGKTVRLLAARPAWKRLAIIKERLDNPNQLKLALA